MFDSDLGIKNKYQTYLDRFRHCSARSNVSFTTYCGISCWSLADCQTQSYNSLTVHNCWYYFLQSTCNAIQSVCSQYSTYTIHHEV